MIPKMDESGQLSANVEFGTEETAMKMRLSVIVPVYNEHKFIEEILCRVQASGLVWEILVIDDGSTDGTRLVLENLQKAQSSGAREVQVGPHKKALRLGNIRFFFQPHNRGKGAAIRVGFAEASGDILLIQDADLEYSPRDYPNLIEPILDGRADVVYGSRFLGGPQRVHLFWHYVGNKFLTLLSDMITNLKLTDIETCYKVFRSEVLQGMNLRSNRFDIEPEITAKVAKKKWRIYEVPISYAGRSYDEGKKITWRDGFSALYSILRYSFFD